MPKDLNEVEFEYFIEAVEWFAKHEKVYSNGIGYVGVSYGGQVALQVAAECNLVKAVVAISAPSSVMNPVKYRNELIGFTTPITEKDVEFKDDCVSIKGCVDKYEDEVIKNQIKAENILAEMMLITGQDDQCLRAVKYANQLKERLVKMGSNKHIIHLSYPKTGHLIEPPYMHLCPMSFHKIYNCLTCWGGQVVEHNAAQKHAWESVIAFLKTTLVKKLNCKL